MSATTTSGSWCVHSTVHESVELLCAFTAHYLDMGASEVHLFLDRPTEEVVETLRRVDGVRLTLCDNTYWAQSSAGHRPDGQVRRQLINANRAYSQAKQDWLLFCDADEYVFSPVDFAHTLAAVNVSDGYAKIGVVERAYSSEDPQQTLFDSTFFRVPVDPAVVDLNEVYGHYAKLFPQGTLGHARGKCVVRTGLPYDLRVHFPVDRDSRLNRQQQQKASIAAKPLSGPKLLHFDGFTPLHWMVKLLKRHQNNQADADNLVRRAEGDQRKRSLQIDEMYAARNDSARLLSLSRAQFIDNSLRHQLQQFGGLFEAKLQIEATARRYFKEVTFDFSVATFDARLREQNAALIAGTAWPFLKV